VIVVLCRIVVGAVFLASGALKLRQRSWPATARTFGAPGFVIPVLPWTELVLGALLAAQIGGPWTPLAALVLLLAFTVAIAVQLARGRLVPCACFGELSAKPVSGMTIVRNAGLCIITLVAVIAG
jgi:uncharacterized membrane protein YphA (DoxX/SURF4 family)